MDWHTPVTAVFAGLIGYLYAAEPSREFVTFTPCGYRPVNLGSEAPFGEIFAVAPNFKRWDVRPRAVLTLSMVQTGQADITCTIVKVGNEHQAVLGTIDEVKAKLLR